MSSYAEHHLIYQVSNASIRLYPFPHFYVEEIFPADFYARLRDRLPSAAAMPQLKTIRPVGPGYSEQRLCVPVVSDALQKLPAKDRDFWIETKQWLLGDAFFMALMEKFRPFLADRFRQLDRVPFMNEALLVDDHTRYALGPHSDSPKKVLTLLFYLPGDLSQEHLGTSLYVPRDPAFRCTGGPHYPFKNFERVYTAPFRPNTLFGFVKTSNSFHGVEPLKESEDCRRQLLLYDVNVPAEFGLGVPPADQNTGSTSEPNSSVRFSF